MILTTIALGVATLLVLLAIRSLRRRRHARAVEWILSVALMLAIVRLLVERPGYVEELGGEAIDRVRRALGLDS